MNEKIIEIKILVSVVKPQRARREAYGSLPVCLCVCVCVCVTDLTSTLFNFEAKAGRLWTENRLLKVFDSWISLKWLCSKVMARKLFFH